MNMIDYYTAETKGMISYFKNCAPQEAEIIMAAESLLEKLKEAKSDKNKQ